ncbi:lysophospholipid acyltransferase family protein [Polymorphobacter fuscus]|nr:lysophospholipid acyltransferase family protein [Polymorphobacter fuscus]NJC08693.1 1-acyl-sn-glycerol-3-phosphate acyltransferase [Polymorphobacter fuscus]
MAGGVTAARRPRRHQRLGPAKGVAGVLAAASMLVPAELVLKGLSGGRKSHLPRLFHRSLSRALGIRILTHGVPARRNARRGDGRGGVLFVSNHVSWADIPVLGARIPAAFVAKSEVGEWGLVGWLATLARTVYVERSRRSSTGEQRDAIAERLAGGENIILFPEGTNSDGTGVLPFKSALFAVTDALPDILIQPVTIAYTRVNGMPVTRMMLPDLAWVGDTELMPHAVGFMALGRVRAEIRFHAPVRAADFADRKALARHCHTVIADGYRALMRG